MNPQENSVTAAALGKKIIKLLEIKKGETFELAKTRDGQVIVKRVEPTATDSV
jgi:hypothetical protein